MMTFLLAVVAACVIGVGLSVIFNWASSRSPLWNIGFAIALVLGTTACVLGVIMLLLRRFTGVAGQP